MSSYNHPKMSIIWSMEKSKIQELLDTSHSFCDVLIKLGYEPHNGNHRTLKERISKDGLSLELLSKNRLTKNIEAIHSRKKKPDEEVFCINSNASRSALKTRIKRNNLLEYKCSLCGNCGIHNGAALSLQIDHINGISNDSRLENLRLLCPNCHSQTPTFSGKRLKRERKAKCISCLKEICIKSKGKKFCEECRKIEAKKAAIRQIKFLPSKEQLEQMLLNAKYNMCEIGRINGVCSNTVKKACIRLGIAFVRDDIGWRKRDALQQLLKENSYSQIAKQVNSHPATVVYWAKKLGILKNIEYIVPVSKEEMESLLNTFSLRNIAKKFNTDHNKVRRWVDELGIDYNSYKNLKKKENLQDKGL